MKTPLATVPTWFQSFTSHLKVHTCTRQGTVVAGLTAAWHLSSDTSLSSPWIYSTQETCLLANPRSQDVVQAPVLSTLHLESITSSSSLFTPSNTYRNLYMALSVDTVGLPGWTAVGVACDHCYGFGHVTALCIVHNHLLISLGLLGAV